MQSSSPKLPGQRRTWQRGPSYEMWRSNCIAPHWGEEGLSTWVYPNGARMHSYWLQRADCMHISQLGFHWIHISCLKSAIREHLHHCHQQALLVRDFFFFPTEAVFPLLLIRPQWQETQGCQRKVTMLGSLEHLCARIQNTPKYSEYVFGGSHMFFPSIKGSWKYFSELNRCIPDFVKLLVHWGRWIMRKKKKWKCMILNCHNRKETRGSSCGMHWGRWLERAGIFPEISEMKKS